MNQIRIRIGEWSIVRTPDRKGLSICPVDVNGLDGYEVILTLGDDFLPNEKSLRIITHLDGVDEPVVNVSLESSYEMVREADNNLIWEDSEVVGDTAPPKADWRDLLDILLNKKSRQ